MQKADRYLYRCRIKMLIARIDFVTNISFQRASTIQVKLLMAVVPAPRSQLSKYDFPSRMKMPVCRYSMF